MSYAKRGHCAVCLKVFAVEDGPVYCKACAKKQRDYVHTSHDNPMSSVSFCGVSDSPSTTSDLRGSNSQHSAGASPRLSKSLPVVCSPDAVSQNAANRQALPPNGDPGDEELNNTSSSRPTERLWQQIHSLNNDGDIHVRPVCGEDDDDELMLCRPTDTAVDYNDEDADDEGGEEDEEMEAEDVVEVTDGNGSHRGLEETDVNREQDGEDQEEEEEEDEEEEEGEYLDDENALDEEDVDDDDDDVGVVAQDAMLPEFPDAAATATKDNQEIKTTDAAGEEASLSLKEAADIASTAGKCRERTAKTRGNTDTVERYNIVETCLADRCDCCSVLTHLRSRKHRHPLHTVHVRDVEDESCSESPSLLCRVLMWFLLLFIVALLLLVVCNLRPAWCHWLRPFGILFNWQLRHVGGSPPI